MSILNNIKSPEQIKDLSLDELNVLCKEIRAFLIEKVSKTGGHLASNLGVVELTISLYNIFDFRKDKIIWDVGHQAYVHKILTGRKDQFDFLRKLNGISGFPKCKESTYDMFETGHSSTSISAGLGMAIARDLNGDNNTVVSVIGDGALTSGMAWEALNDLGYRKTKMIIILNDNAMSISKNVGGLSTYLSNFRSYYGYNKFKSDVHTAIEKTDIGKGVASSLHRLKRGIKQLVIPGMLFEDMGIKYLGPIDGHNIKEMSKVFTLAKQLDGPVIIHTVTKKGKGYNYAEKNPHKFHGIGPFDCSNGEIAATNVETYSKVFGDELLKIAEKDEKIVAITAAMPGGTGLTDFSKKYPKRFFDVGIAEQHAVTLAAGMAKNGLKPVFAVYSTFLQRAYDQVLHDVCIQNLPVVLCLDRSGIVGEDGETHQGIFDLSYLSHIPNITIIAPKCTEELRYILKWAFEANRPVAIRYPRGGDDDVIMKPIKSFKHGKWEIIKEGKNIAIIATGKMVARSIKVCNKLYDCGIEPMLINANFIKPLDYSLINDIVEKGFSVVTIEDNVICGGMGSSILQYISSLNSGINVLNLGFEDKFIEQGNVNELYKIYGLDVDGITKRIVEFNEGVING
jgi:1-deoxy-D-xylulose-5-phosphate synthase